MNETEELEPAEGALPYIRDRVRRTTTNLKEDATKNPNSPQIAIAADLASTSDSSPKVEVKVPSTSPARSLTKQHQTESQQQQGCSSSVTQILLSQLVHSKQQIQTLSPPPSSSSSSSSCTSLVLSPPLHLQQLTSADIITSFGICKVHQGIQMTPKRMGRQIAERSVRTTTAATTKSTKNLSNKTVSAVAATDASDEHGNFPADLSSSDDDSDGDSSDNHYHLSLLPRKGVITKQITQGYLDQSTQLYAKQPITPTNDSILPPLVTQYPRQFICVEKDCWESSRLCCAKCLSSGAHGGHEAISVRTMETQLQTEVRGAKLTTIRQQIKTDFKEIQRQIEVCEESFLKQFDKAFADLENQHTITPFEESNLDQSIKLWQAYYQPEKSLVNEHIGFIAEESLRMINAIQSRTVNLETSSLLFKRKLTKFDVEFTKQLKNIETDLKAAQFSLSAHAKQALAALPAFVFQNPDLENSQAVAMKKFEFAERTEFIQINAKTNEPYGRCLIFWRDGAYRIGYYQQGKSNGVCRMVWENGNVYEGNYLLDKKEGKGFFVKFADNTSYFGDFKNDAKNGQGIEYYPNATNYVGEFKDWKPHGAGTLFSSTTQQPIKSGYWISGKLTSSEQHH